MTEGTSASTLADLCDLISVQVDPHAHASLLYVGLEHVPTGRFTRISGGSATDVRSSKFAFKLGDVLYGKLRPYLDKAVLADGDGVCTTELLVLRAKVGVPPEFLVAVVHCRAFIEHAVSGTTGVQHPRTSWHRIREFELPNFTGSERGAIAALCWTAHDALSACERTIEHSLNLKRAATRELFTRGIRGETQKEAEIGPIPNSWSIACLGSLGRIGNGSTPKRTISAYWTGGAYPWLTSAKVYDRNIVAADQFVTQQALDECHLPKVAPGAVLMAITGQGKTLGHCAVLEIEATVSQHVAYMNIAAEKTDPRFVRGYLETQYEYLRQVASGGGSTKGALTCAFLRSLPIPMPLLDEQREIVAILDALDKKIDLHKQKRAVLDDLFKALLQKLMTGEIRVADLDLSALGAAA